jgi:hypothetical protein
MVDLAGSERLMLKVKRLKESQFINKSLSALGDVISASKTALRHMFIFWEFTISILPIIPYVDLVTSHS